MESIYFKKTKSTFQSAPEEAKSKTPALPNSLLLAMHGEQSGGRHNPELENIMKSRLAAFRHQIPAAENEADKLSSGITSGTPEQVKQSMGERLGTDFSSVKFHTGESISQKADNMGARAWTQGNDVYFGEGGFHPTVAAHELVHTVQQGAVESGAVHVSAPMGGAQMNLKNWFKDICHRIKNCCGCGQQILPKPVLKSKSQQSTGSDNNEVDLFYKNRSLDSSRNALEDLHQTAAAQQQERDRNIKNASNSEKSNTSKISNPHGSNKINLDIAHMGSRDNPNLDKGLEPNIERLDEKSRTKDAHANAYAQAVHAQQKKHAWEIDMKNRSAKSSTSIFPGIHDPNEINHLVAHAGSKYNPNLDADLEKLIEKFDNEVHRSRLVRLFLSEHSKNPHPHIVGLDEYGEKASWDINDEDEIDVNRLRDRLKNMARVIRDYPQLKEHINDWVRLDDGTSMATSPDAKNGTCDIYYNPYIDENNEQKSNCSGSMNARSTDNRYPSTPVGYEGTHELGHVFHYMLTFLSQNSRENRERDIKNDYTPKKLIKCSMESFQKKNPEFHLEKSENSLIDIDIEDKSLNRYVSEYAQTGPREMIAEAFADVYSRGKNASPFNIELVKTCHKQLKNILTNSGSRAKKPYQSHISH